LFASVFLLVHFSLLLLAGLALIGVIVVGDCVGDVARGVLRGREDRREESTGTLRSECSAARGLGFLGVGCERSDGGVGELAWRIG
jgi:hypothetical protein